MPTYEFRCPDGHEFERFYRKISDAPAELACPECGKLATRKLSGGAGLVFKGSGFYLTDYGKNAHRKGGAGESSSGDAKDGAKSDASKHESTAPAGGASENTPKSDKASDAKSAPPAGGSSSGGSSGSSGGSSGGSSSSSPGGKADK